MSERLEPGKKIHKVEASMSAKEKREHRLALQQNAKNGINTDLRTRSAREIIQSGKLMPLEIMVAAMHYVWDESVQHESKLSDPVVQSDPEELKKFRMLTKATKLEAAAIAKEAAPYLHARLAAVTVSGDQDNPLRMQLDSLIITAESLKSKIRVIEQPKEVLTSPKEEK